MIKKYKKLGLCIYILVASAGKWTEVCGEAYNASPQKLGKLL
jgi:hypothetical protein